MSTKPLIYIIIGSTREGRIGEKVGNWASSVAQVRDDATFELIDLKDWELPNYHEANTPKALNGKYSIPLATQWAEKISKADGFIIITPEYNHGYPAVLKNALDYLYTEWNKKPVAFISYGGAAGGARAVEQLRSVVIELEMAPIRETVTFSMVFGMFDDQGRIKDEQYHKRLNTMIDQLMWWTRALNVARIGK